MPDTLKVGSKGASVRTLQKLLGERGYPCEADGDFGRRTLNAVKAFQSQNLDSHGQPLTVDGTVGPLTWWSLTHPKPKVEPFSPVDFAAMPPASAGGSRVGRESLRRAIAELSVGAGEVGGNNSGPHVRKYLKPAGLPEGNSWCAAFVSWCYMQARRGEVARMPFPFCAGARALLGHMKSRGWAHPPGESHEPVPGDLVVWWRVQAQGWQGHVGLVHQCKDGMLYTIEGNRAPKVQGFSYVLSRMDKLLGYGHVPD